MNKYFIKWQYQRLCESQAQLPPGVEILKDVKFAATDDLAEVFLKLLQTVFESMADAKTGAPDKNCAGRLVSFTDGDGAGSMHWNLMSGEALTEGSVRYTLKPIELHGVMPVEMEFLIFKTVEEIGKSAETLQQALDAVKGRKIEIFSGGQFYRANRIRTVKLPAGEGDKWIMCAELFLEETEAPAVGADLGGDGELKVDPNTAGGFIAAFEQLQKDTGRDLSKMKLLANQDDKRLFGIYPQKVVGDNIVFSLQSCLGVDDDGNKFGGPENLEDTSTVKELVDWLKAQNKPKANLFFKHLRFGTFDIEDVDFKAGKPPTLTLRPWGQLDESDTIEDWAGYCEDAEKDTAGNIDAGEFVEARGLDESRICRMVKDLTRGEVQARRLCEALVETADIMTLRRRLDRAGLGFGYSLRESADLGRYEGRLCITDTGRFMTWFG